MRNKLLENLALLGACLFILLGCNPTGTYTIETQFPFDVSIEDIGRPGKIVPNGQDTVFIDDPLIIYQSSMPIKAVAMSVLDSTGNVHQLDCWYRQGGNEVRTYNDLIYAIENPVSIRFNITTSD